MFPAMAGGMMPNAGGGLPQPSPVNSLSSGSLATVDRVRSVFPETWLWTNATSGYHQNTLVLIVS